MTSHDQTTLLKRAWRNEKRQFKGNLALSEVANNLISVGVGTLVWNRFRDNAIPAGTEYGQLFFAAAARNAIRFNAQLTFIQTLNRSLKQSNIPHVFIKGLALGSYYASPQSRPVGDIDLCCGKERYEDAVNEVARLTGNSPLRIGEKSTTLHMRGDRLSSFISVDVHKSLSAYELDDSALKMAKKVWTFGLELPTLSEEEHLRLICLHFLKHGGWRPIWLCDVAAMAESLPSDFDWDRCMKDERTAHYVSTVLELSRRILGAEFEMAGRYRPASLPDWLTPEVLRQWSMPHKAHMPKSPIRYTLANEPKKLPSALAARWPKPLHAVFIMKGRFGKAGPAIFQYAAFVKKTLQFFYWSIMTRKIMKA